VCCLCLLSTFPLHYYRKEPTFVRVRPFALLAGVNVATSIVACGYLLPHAVADFPCWLELVIHSVGAIFILGYFSIRPYLFVIESLVAERQANEDAIIGLEDNQSHSPSAGEDIVQGSGRVEALKTFIGVAFLFRAPQQLTLRALLDVRRNYVFVTAMVVVPPLAALTACLLALPCTRSGCVQCPFFAEFWLIVLAPTSFVYLLPIMRVVYVGRQIEKDSQAVMKEVRVLYSSAISCGCVDMLSLRDRIRCSCVCVLYCLFVLIYSRVLLYL
jgi:hypothetical protein